MQNFDANYTNVTEARTNEHTNGRMDEQKDENYIPLGINAGGIMNGRYTFLLPNVINFNCFQVQTLNQIV